MGYGEGSVYLDRTSGRWKGRVPDGRGGYRYVTGTDEHEVRARWRELRRQTARTTSRRGGERVRDYLPRWLRDVAAVRLRPRTLHGHTQIVDNHLIPALGRYRVRDLSQADVQRMVTALRRDHAPQTVHNVVHVLSSALQQAMREDMVDRNVARLVVLPRRGRDPLPELTEAQVRAFLVATREHRHWPIWALAATTGMRRGEILGLLRRDVSADTVAVTGTYRRIPNDGGWKREEPKTPRSRRAVSLPLLARIALRQALSQSVSVKLVFARANGDPLDPDHITKTFTRELARQGLPPVRFHSLRHVAATSMLEQLGGDMRAVSAQLGHSSITTTLDVYATTADEARRRAAAAMDKVMEGLA